MIRSSSIEARMYLSINLAPPALPLIAVCNGRSEPGGVIVSLSLIIPFSLGSTEVANTV